MQSATHKESILPEVGHRESIFVNMNTDISIWHKVKQDDEQSFELLFKKYYLRLCHYACSFVNNMPEAEDLVQAAFITIWENKDTIEIESSFKSYIYKVVKNRSLNTLRGNKRREKHYKNQQDRLQNDISIDYDSETELLNEMLFEGLESLPPKCKKIFQLSRMEGLKHKEIAELMEIKPKTVENQIGIALKFLRRHLADFLRILLLTSYTINF